MSGHTPGPWHVPCFATKGTCNCKSVLSEHQTGMGSICQVPHGGEDEPLSRAIANARLIATAPELLNIAQRTEDMLTRQRWRDDGDDPESKLLRDCRAAIFKATQ